MQKVFKHFFVVKYFPFLSHQGPIPRGHGHVMASRGIQLCSLPLLPGRPWVCGREESGVLWALLWAVLCSRLRPLPPEDSRSGCTNRKKYYSDLLSFLSCICKTPSTIPIFSPLRKSWMPWNRPGMCPVSSVQPANNRSGATCFTWRMDNHSVKKVDQTGSSTT